jgi:hypothetical protein
MQTRKQMLVDEEALRKAVLDAVLPASKASLFLTR